MRMVRRLVTAILSVIALVACLTTVTVPGMSAVTVLVRADRTASIKSGPVTLGMRLERLAAALVGVPEASAYIPSIVANVRLTVTAADISTLERTEQAAGRDSVTILVEVPVGPARNFLVQGLSATGAIVFSGQVTVDLTGAAADIPVVMQPGTTSIPQVIATDPADGATGIGGRPVIAVTFSEAMDPSTITAATFTLVETRSGTAVAGAVGAAGAAATFTPAADLAPNATYTATLTTGVRSAYGIPLGRSVVWLFTTLPTVPAVTATTPSDGEVNVPINAVLTAVFSEEMDPATINAGTFLVGGVTGSVTSNAAGRTATFVPDSLLASGTVHTATITTGARSTLGVPLGGDHVWSFTTGSATDMTPPSFSGISSVATLSLTSAQLSWQAADDDRTAVQNIVYLVFQRTQAGSYPADPTAVTPPGALTFTATGLTPGTVYYFRVNARDEAGNIDANTAELPNAASGWYVDAVFGNDANNGSAGSPFKTITRALAVTSPTTTLPVGIIIAPGLYDGPSNGETFPLQMRPETTLYCLGTGSGAVIDATGSGADALYGNANAVIDQCRIVPEAGRTGIDDRIGGAGGSAARTTVRNSIVDGPAADAVVLSANSSIATTTVSGAGLRGISILNGRPSIIGCSVQGKETGIEVAADTDPSIDDNRIENNSIGIIVIAAGGRPSVRNNIIANNIKGIVVAAGDPLIHKNEVRTNVISGNDVGIEIAGGMPTVSFNAVTGNDVGVSVAGGTPTIKSNTIACNAIADLQVLVNAEADARNNSWDHAPPDIDLAPCLAGMDICYTFAVTGLPLFTPYGPAAVCP